MNVVLFSFQNSEFRNTSMKQKVYNIYNICPFRSKDVDLSSQWSQSRSDLEGVNKLLVICLCPVFGSLYLPASPIELKMFSVTSRMRSVASPWRPIGWAPLAYCLMC